MIGDSARTPGDGEQPDITERIARDLTDLADCLEDGTGLGDLPLGWTKTMEMLRVAAALVDSPALLAAEIERLRSVEAALEAENARLQQNQDGGRAPDEVWQEGFGYVIVPTDAPVPIETTAEGER